MSKRRIRIPEGLDNQGRWQPGSWIEVEDDKLPDDGDWAFFGLLLTVGLFALVVWVVL